MCVCLYGCGCGCGGFCFELLLALFVFASLYLSSNQNFLGFTHMYPGDSDRIKRGVSVPPLPGHVVSRNGTLGAQNSQPNSYLVTPEASYHFRSPTTTVRRTTSRTMGMSVISPRHPRPSKARERTSVIGHLEPSRASRNWWLCETDCAKFWQFGCQIFFNCY